MEETEKPKSEKAIQKSAFQSLGFLYLSFI